jgi:nucleoside-diphosphate-sugar epimerase
MAKLNPKGGGYRIALRPAMDVSRAQQELGHRAEYGLDKGLPAYVAWLRERKYL